QGFDATRCGALAASLARNHSWQVPTLISYERFDCSAPGDLARDVRVRYVSPRRQMAWPKIRAALAQSIAADAELARADSLICAGALDRLTGFLAKAGVPLLAGTDAGVPYVLYGFGLHEELSLLAQAGLGPAGALRAATLNPAMFLGATDSLGAVAAGKLADLVLLDADPLADITNTTKIRAVFANGRYFDRSALDSLLGAAARAANGSR
ncbi:MAG TPA: amidohydrolase family protein, partial [Gemmatimonadaceae bacterium]|nr:amidohydrolase family protein [Gemmatimonadaceae bacterium]